jgi:hypothetical protein
MKKIDLSGSGSEIIQDQTGTQSFTMLGPMHGATPGTATNPTVDFTTKPHDLIIGARVAFEFCFRAENLQGVSDPSQLSFKDFFRFVLLPENQDLKAELIEPAIVTPASSQSATPGSRPASTTGGTSGTGTAPTVYTVMLKYYTVLHATPGENMVVATALAKPPATRSLVTIPPPPTPIERSTEDIL